MCGYPVTQISDIAHENIWKSLRKGALKRNVNIRVSRGMSAKYTDFAR